MIFSDIPSEKSHDHILRQVGNCLVGILLFILPAHAQKQKLDSCFAGVFITQEDFINNHLSYKINTAVKDYRLVLLFRPTLHLR